jgi:hypothetical protein
MLGYFVEKPLPSSGLLPFIRGYACELNDSCYDTSINNNYDKHFLYQFKKFTLNVTNRLQRFQSVASLVNSTVDVWTNSIAILSEKNVFALKNLGRMIQYDYEY